MTAQVPRAPVGARYHRPAPARNYDYMLRGQNHFETDVQAAERILSVVPEIRDCAWSNRGFHQRAAKWIAERGVRQFLDIGSGLPTVGNTHEVVQKVIPGARVMYVDNDPMVAEQGSACSPRTARPASSALTCVSPTRSWATPRSASSSTSASPSACCSPRS